MVRVAYTSVFIWLALYSLGEAQLSFFGRKHPVKTVTVDQVYQFLTSQADAEKQAVAEDREKPRATFVLVDVRSAKEQAVSVIPGAITATQYEKTRKQHQGKTVIAYCTIGVRSEQYARKLIAAGETAVNFKASILGWCEAQHPLVTPQGEPTKQVHTYSARYKVPSEYTAVY